MIADAASAAEIARLAGTVPCEWIDTATALALPGLMISGEQSLDAAVIAAALDGDAEAATLLREGGGTAALTQAERQLIAATAKAEDGIVSRHVNRPISQAVTRLLLQFDGVRPIHATIAAALLAIVMVACLFGGTQSGLIAGALLFQAASMLDGVDGEIARATFRSSAEGARLDSMIDAASNLGFIGGVTFNLYVQGHPRAAVAGLVGLACLATGLFLIGRRARADADGLTFNAVKDHFRARRSKLMDWLTWLTMRDFFALAGALLIIAGLAVPALVAFAVVAAGWLVVVLTVLTRQEA